MVLASRSLSVVGTIQQFGSASILQAIAAAGCDVSATLAFVIGSNRVTSSPLLGWLLIASDPPCSRTVRNR